MPHDVTPAVPAVEFADDRDATGVRGPDREMDAGRAFVGNDVGAELVEEAEMRAFGGVIIVDRSEDRPVRRP